MLNHIAAFAGSDDVYARHTTYPTSESHDVEKIPPPINGSDHGGNNACPSPGGCEYTHTHATSLGSDQQAADDSVCISSCPSTPVELWPAVSASQSQSLFPGTHAEVPPYAVPVQRYSRLYCGNLSLPPGMTKRALGRLRIVCCCVVTAQSWHAFFVALLILAITMLFVAVVVPHGEWFTHCFMALLTAASIACLTLSVTLDPGVIPPASLSQQPAQPTTVVVEGRSVQCKLCTTCHIIRPPQSSHCRFCDVCVEEFDHHCVVLGSCVGKRTFRFFGGFFITTSFLTVYMCIRSFVVIVSTDFKPAYEQPNLIWLAMSCTLCMFFGLAGCILVIPCACRYIKLSATRTTMKERRRQRYQTQSGEEPFSHMPVAVPSSTSYFVNIIQRFFGPMERSKIPFDYYV
ncbi:hypothetical protein JKF63_01255 [Porcisia hertigi]|uniref:Palmitoyltransferase n=1 Tax=Porcisia hertigi TaxID=2761500 RepID=A0A836HG58_9TRYP|nr:hypothetical protein JKF63_01255 [Porcisia hertigi]